MKSYRLIYFLLLVACFPNYSEYGSHDGIKILDEMSGDGLQGNNSKFRHLEKAKKHCKKFNKQAVFLSSNISIKPYYEIYECKFFKKTK